MIGNLPDFQAYASARGNEAPSLADEEVAAQALLRASDYVSFNYVLQFLPGFTEASPHVDSAVYEAAILELETPGLFTTTYTLDQRKVLTQVDTIKWSLVEGSSGKSDFEKAAPTSTRIEAMLSPYMPGSVGFGVRSVG